MTKVMIENILFDFTSNEAILDDRRIRLEQKVMEILLLFARNAHKTITSDEILSEVWPEIVVTQDSISQCISKLRQVFKDDPRKPRVIETIPKKGYRLIAQVQFVDESQIDHDIRPLKQTSNPKSTAGILAAIAFLVTGLILYGTALGWGTGLGITIGVATIVYVMAYFGVVKFSGGE